MSQVELAKRYAKALHQLGHQKGKVKEYQTQLRSIAEVVGGSDVLSFFANTSVTQENKRKSLDNLFRGAQFDDDIKGFLYLLIDKSRMTILPDIVRAGQELLDEEEGITRGKIKSPARLSDGVKAEYEQKIGRILKRKIYLEPVIDEKIMGGVRVEIGGWTFDDSLETHLSQLGDKLLSI